MKNFLLGMFICAGLGAQDATLRRIDGKRLGAAEAERIAREELERAKVTGAQIVILDRGKIVWKHAFGMRRADGALPMENNTTTWAASITKAVFGTYVMHLVECGELSLDLPVAQQLEKRLDTYEPFKETATALVVDPNWVKVTPRMLLAHSSGLHNFAFLEPDKRMHLQFAPGSQFRYSGEGLNIVQFLIEEKKKRPLDQLMQEAIFGPLGMTQTGMIYRQDFAANVADRYGAAGQFLAQTKRYPARASGNMMSSAEDLGKFAEGLFAGKVLGRKAMAAMLKPQLMIRSKHQFAFAANEGEGEEAKAVGLAYGMGWGLYTKTKYGKAFFKEGHGDGAQNYMLCFEKRQACFIVLTNSDNGESAFRGLMEKIWGNTVTPWEWHSYTPEAIERARRAQ